MQKSALRVESLEDAIQVAQARAMQGDLLSRLGYAGAGMAGLGIAARGVQGLTGLYRRNVKKQKRPVTSPIRVPINYPVEEKAAGVVGPGSFLRGDQATSMSGIPWAMPASLAIAGGGLYGGWKLADKLLDARRKDELKRELEASKAEYEAALLSEFDAPKQKIGSSTELSRTLDKTYDQFKKLEKRSGAMETLTDPLTYTDGGGKLTGLYATMAALAAGGSGVASYQYFKKRQEAELLRKAQKNRQRRLYDSQHTPMYAESVPVSAK